MAFTDIYADWQTISIGAGVLSFLVAIILLQLSRVFSLKNLEQTAKSEAVYAISTILIVLVVLAMVEMVEPFLASGSQRSVAKCFYLSSFQCACDSQNLDMTFNDPAIGTPTTLIDWTRLYMATPQSCIKDVMTTLYWASIPLEFCASMYAEIFMSEVASGFACKPFAERITNTASQLTFFSYIYYLVDYILLFIKYYAGFFFSIGVAMRAFPPTRGAGAYVMALMIGLYFIFPLSYILMMTISAPHVQAQIIVPQNQVAPGGSCAPPPGASGNFRYVCAMPRVTDPHDTGLACQSLSTRSAFTIWHRIAALSDALFTLFTFTLNELFNHLANAVCIFPSIAVLVTLTVVLNTTGLFGGNIPEIGRGLIKLI